MTLRLVCLALLGISGILAQGFPDISNSTTCDPLCVNLTRAGYTFETSQHANPGSSFYTVPSNFSGELTPGSVLAVEVGTNLTNYTVPSSLTMSRFLYVTSDLNGTVLPASAYIIWPAIDPSSQSTYSNSSAFSMVAWAHGTSGLFPACAPSNYKALQYHFMVPFALALQGIVVVAPDYAGLGVGWLPNGDRIPHAYGAVPAQANDLANAILAARSAFPILSSSPYVVAGHSQGGAIAWGYAERQAVQPISGYKGTVTFAPLVDFVSVIAAANADFANGVIKPWTIPSLSFIQRSVIAGVTAVYPSFNYTGMTTKVYDRFHNVLAKIQGCLPSDNIVFSNIPLTELGEASWTNTTTALEFQRRVKVSGKKIEGPMLVLSGELDTTVALDTVDAAVDATCAANSGHNSTAEIEYIVYKGQDHFPLIQASQNYWMQWIKDRLHGITNNKSGEHHVTASCTKRNVEIFRGEFNKKTTTSNWLVTGVGPTEIWKYTL